MIRRLLNAIEKDNDSGRMVEESKKDREKPMLKKIDIM